MTTDPLQKPHLQPWGFVAIKERWKVTVEDTGHDMMVHLKQHEAGGGPVT